MSFKPEMYEGFIAADSPAQQRLIRQYQGTGTNFDIIIVGSGVGGGVLADALADKGPSASSSSKRGRSSTPRTCTTSAGSSTTKSRRNSAAGTFRQQSESEERRTLYRRATTVELRRALHLLVRIDPHSATVGTRFLPPKVREDLVEHPDRLKRDERDLLHRAGEKMNQSVSMGRVAEKVVERLRNSWLAADFLINQTPRALHQPYLQADGTPKDEFFTEPTGVFNTAELLINQLGLNPGYRPKTTARLHLLLNHFVEDVQNHNDRLNLVVRNTLTGQAKTFQAGKVVLAGGSIESPKLLLRSSMYPSLPRRREGVGRPWADGPSHHRRERNVCRWHRRHRPHPQRPLQDHLLLPRVAGREHEIRYPFNVEMNLNHEYWHLRKNDPADHTDADFR